MTSSGKFFGIGVGPGEPGLIPVAAWNTLKECDVIFVPRAKSMSHSVARRCLPTNEIPDHRFREIEFAMETDRLRTHSSCGDFSRANCRITWCRPSSRACRNFL